MKSLLGYSLVLASVVLGVWALLREERVGGREQMTYGSAKQAVEVQLGTGLLGAVLIMTS